MSQNYSAWDIDAASYPVDSDLAAKIDFLLGYGILAPSTHNTQPWIFEVGDKTLILSSNPALALTEGDPVGRNLYISLGCCAFNIMVAAAHFGIMSKPVFDEKSGNITLFFEETGAPIPIAKLFTAITKRYTDKRILPLTPITDHTLAEIQNGQMTGATFSFIKHADQLRVHKVAAAFERSIASYATMPKFGQELSGWLRTNNTNASDGMPGTPSGLSNAQTVVGKTLLNTIPFSIKVLGKKYVKLIKSSPVVGLLSTDADTPAAWFGVGLKYEEIALAATMHEISVTPMAAIVESSERSELVGIFKANRPFSQMFFRLAVVGKSSIHSPRRLRGRAKIGSEALLLDMIDAPVELHSMKVGTKTIRYVESGTGEPLVLLHGATIGWGAWHTNIAELSKHYKVYALDLPGTGSSTPVKYRSSDIMQDFVEPVAAFMHSLKLTNVTIIGHSFGAFIAMKLALNNPEMVKKLILVSPLGLMRRIPLKQLPVVIYPLAKLIASTVMRPTRKNMSDFMRSALRNKNAVNETLIDHFHEAVLKNPESHPLLFMNGLSAGPYFRSELFLGASLSDITQPTLVIIGRHDPLVPVEITEAAAHSIPHVTIEIFESAGHVAPMELPQKFNSTVIEFLKTA